MSDSSHTDSYSDEQLIAELSTVRENYVDAFQMRKQRIDAQQAEAMLRAKKSALRFEERCEAELHSVRSELHTTVIQGPWLAPNATEGRSV
jgi:hypothetical protein